MSDGRGGESRWSSARERQERDRAREREREAARKARLEGRDEPAAGGAFPGGGSSGENPRRLTDEERRTIREYRFPSPSSSRSAPSSPPAGGTPSEPPSIPLLSSLTPEARPVTSRRSSLGTSRKWRSAVEAASVAPTAPTLPDLPGDTGDVRSGGRGGNSRLIVFGAILFLLMGVVAFLPFGPLGRNDDGPPPTPSSTLPSILTPTIIGGAGEPPTPEPTPPLVADDERVVCIDPGHGGWDTGWNRSDQNEPPVVTEAELNLGLSFMLKEELEANGVTVVMTRVSGGAVNAMEEDVNGDGMRRRDFENPDQAKQAGSRDDLQARINICNDAEADVMISVHFNGYDDPSVDGYEIYYTAAPYRPFGDLNRELANLVYRQLDRTMQESDYGGFGRGAIDDTKLDAVQHDFGTEDHLVMTGPAVTGANYTITPTNMPGIIVEGAFLSNDDDARFVIQPANQRLMAEAYARGILEYFERHPG